MSVIMKEWDVIAVFIKNIGEPYERERKSESVSGLKNVGGGPQQKRENIWS